MICRLRWHKWLYHSWEGEDVRFCKKCHKYQRHIFFYVGHNYGYEWRNYLTPNVLIITGVEL